MRCRNSILGLTRCLCMQPQGQPFNAIQNYFPDGTPIGLLNVRSGACLYNPDASAVVQAGESGGLPRSGLAAQPSLRSLHCLAMPLRSECSATLNHAASGRRRDSAYISACLAVTRGACAT